MEAATSPDLARLFADRTEAFRTDLREDLTAGIAKGTIRPGLPVEETTAAIVAQLRGIAIQLLVTPESLDLPALRVFLTDHWRRALTGGGHGLTR